MWALCAVMVIINTRWGAGRDPHLMLINTTDSGRHSVEEMAFYWAIFFVTRYKIAFKCILCWAWTWLGGVTVKQLAEQLTQGYQRWYRGDSRWEQLEDIRTGLRSSMIPGIWNIKKFRQSVGKKRRVTHPLRRPLSERPRFEGRPLPSGDTDWEQGLKVLTLHRDQPGSGRWGLLNRTNKTTHTWLEMRRGVAEFDGGSWLMTFSILYGYLFESTPNIMMKCGEKLSLLVIVFYFGNMNGKDN